MLGIKNHRKPDEKTLTIARQRSGLLTDAACTVIEATCTAEGCHLGHALRGYRDCLAALLAGRATVDDVAIWEDALPRYARGLIVTLEMDAGYVQSF